MASRLFRVGGLKQTLSNSLFRNVEPERVVDSLRSLLHPRASHVLSELSYVDRDFTSAFYMQSSRSFLPADRDTQRFHFFDGPIDPDLILSGGSAVTAKIKYLGYTLVRPGVRRSIGRTVLAPPTTVDGYPAYFPCQGTFSTSIGGLEWEVNGCPYLSQDSSVMACATAALWMGTVSLQQKDGEAKVFSTREITSVALGLDHPFGPSVGRAGLTLQQMNDALLRMGYDSSLVENPSPERLKNALYAYCESGLAPVLFVGYHDDEEGEIVYHAVTVVGHTCGDVERLEPDLFDHCVSASAFAPHFLFHDDQQGPYLPGVVEPLTPAPDDHTSPEAKAYKEGARSIFRSTRAATPLKGFVFGLLVASPSRVMLDYTAAVTQTINRAIGWARNNQSIEEDALVVVRPILVRSRALKRYIRERSSIPNQLRSVLLDLPMPRYVWFVEFAHAREWTPHDPERARTFGAAILDSTAAPHGEAVLAMYVPGVAATTRAKGRTLKVEYHLLPKSARYEPFALAARP